MLVRQSARQPRFEVAWATDAPSRGLSIDWLNNHVDNQGHGQDSNRKSLIYKKSHSTAHFLGTVSVGLSLKTLHNPVDKTETGLYRMAKPLISNDFFPGAQFPCRSRAVIPIFLGQSWG
ncbi:hypothetical protein [Diaphorobacter aerolatus]|uniref:Uncharacterized protein n=1 Tax=Diaphorobacter aerolatus TaxID=1288495 RepID=A0A7H0GM79_9BURK|nr:hypothetical protein [Diaphorobacter aerolatus]QNP49395.1 hypothetical protein H9K75_04945 [Diaphorobacter aerolatus]